MSRSPWLATGLLLLGVSSALSAPGATTVGKGPVWSHSFDVFGPAGYTVTMDQAQRNRHGGLLYFDSGKDVIQLGLDLQERAVPSQLLPKVARVRRPTGVFQSPSGFQLFDFCNEARQVSVGWSREDAWVLPIPCGTRFDYAGRPLSSYRDLFDDVFLSDDGRSVVTVPSALSVPIGTWHETPFHGALFFDARGERVARVVDERADFETASMAEDGSLFAYVSEGAVVALGPDGARRWSASLDGECVERDRLRVAPRGRAVAVSLAPHATLPASRHYLPAMLAPSTRVLDAHGRWLRLGGSPEVSGSPAAFSGDGSCLLVMGVGGSTADLFELQTGVRAWTAPPPPPPSPSFIYPDISYYRVGAVDGRGRRVAILGGGQTSASWSGGSPDILVVAVWDTWTQTRILSWEVRSEEIVHEPQGNWNLWPTDLRLSDDGKWLLADGGGWLFLFELP